MELVLLSLASLPLALPTNQQGPAAAVQSKAGVQPLVFVNGSDNCSTPDIISGGGPHNFVNVSATTDGCSNCNPCGSIQRDVWFRWTAFATGVCSIDLCAGTSGFDSVVAVYNGTNCPVAPAIACNDDFCALISQATFSATAGSTYVFQLGSFGASPGGSGSFQLSIGPGPANDSCTTPTVIAGPGPHPFDNTSATNGVQGQSEGICFASGTTAIGRDVWYSWTAGSTGRAALTTCGQTGIDSKVAVYPGSGCPVQAAIACDDDACGLQSQACVDVTIGQPYTLQIGVFPGAAGGPGTFTIPITAPVPPCQCDDGGTENIFGWLAGGEMGWMQRFGGVAGSTTVSSIQVTWGTAAFPGLSPGNGSSSKVAIWDDPNDDGNPNDAVLVQLVLTTVQQVDTDNFVTVPITPVVVNGYFFLGAGLAHSAGQFVAPMDTSCPLAGVAYFFGNNNANPVNYANPSANAVPPTSFEVSGFPTVVMVRSTSCQAAPGITFCEPGLNGVIPCPCGNSPSGPGRGCNNSVPTGGATLVDTGVASLSTDTVVFTTGGERPTSLSIVLQGNALIAAGTMFGDGVRCTGGALKRLYTKNAVGGSISAPTGGELPVHIRSANTGDPIPPNAIRYYQVYYRDPFPAGCLPISPGVSTFNSTSGRWIRWSY